jgi:DNA-binding NarL/FixJ family response regulator
VLTQDAQLHTGERTREQGIAVLIASGPVVGAIAKLLSAHGLQTTTCEDIEGLPSGEIDVNPAIVVLWIEDPSSSLARVVGALARRFDGAPVLLVCDNLERWAIRSAMMSGAAGVVLRDELDSAFGACLRAVLAGQACVPRLHQQQIEPPALSAREKQILGLVVMGYMNSQIAEQLFLAESTVKSHLSSAFGKLGVRSRNEAVNLIVNPDSGLGLGILGLGGESIDSNTVVTG